MALTTVDQGLLGTYAQYTGFKNRIINGAMVIDQRNAGASVTQGTTGTQYSVDRWGIYGNVTSKFTAQQSTTVPAGYINSLLITSSSAYSVASGDNFLLYQKIEGLNTTDLGWGAVGAQSVTLSFWVRSSLTGTFGGSIQNSAQNYCYPFSYTISSANTWEQKSITITGPTSGTWLTTNGIGVGVQFGIGVGSTYSGTAGAWAATTYISATGATSIIGTSGATWYITGVQLEKGSTATSFDYRPYGTELALCQRYCFLTSTNSPYNGGADSTTSGIFTIYHPVTMRAIPSVSVTSVWKADNYATVAATGTGASGAGRSPDVSTVNVSGFSPAFTAKDNLQIIPGNNAGIATITAEL
jgi:hypothetical protein